MNFNTGKICLLLAMLIAYTSTMSCSHSPSGIRHRAFSDPETLRALQKHQQFKQDAHVHEKTVCPPQPILERQTNSPNINQPLLPLSIEIPDSNDWSSNSSGKWSKQGNSSPTLFDIVTEREKLATICHMLRVKELLQEPDRISQTDKPNQIKYRALQAASVILPVATMALLNDNSNDQTRFGLVAATTIISLLPTILTTIVGIYGVYQIDQMLHAEERAALTNLRHAIKLENQKRYKEIDEEFKKLYSALNKETADRKTGDKDSVKNIVTLTTDLKQKLSNAVEEYHKASNTLSDALNTVTEVKKLNEHLLANYPNMMRKLDEILHHASNMSRNMENNNSNDYVHSQLDNIEYFINNNNVEEDNNEKEEEKDDGESDTHSKIKVKRTPRQTKILSTPLPSPSSHFPAGTPVTPSGHASPVIFKAKKKQQNGILGWLAKNLTSTPSSSTDQK